MNATATSSTPKTLTLADVERSSPFHRRVTWQNLIALIKEAQRVHVCFSAYESNLVTAEGIGRAIEIPKVAALARAVDGVRWHAAKPEFVSVYACSGSLYFGS